MCAYVLVVETRGLGRFRPVSWTITQFWGPEVISTIDEPRGCVYVSVINTHNFGQTITHRFGVPERFPRFTIPGVRLRARRQHS
jgi:hypothetical protein